MDIITEDIKDVESALPEEARCVGNGAFGWFKKVFQDGGYYVFIEGDRIRVRFGQKQLRRGFDVVLGA